MPRTPNSKDKGRKRSNNTKKMGAASKKVGSATLNAVSFTGSSALSAFSEIAPATTGTISSTMDAMRDFREVSRQVAMNMRQELNLMKRSVAGKGAARAFKDAMDSISDGTFTFSRIDQDLGGDLDDSEAIFDDLESPDDLEGEDGQSSSPEENAARLTIESNRAVHNAIAATGSATLRGIKEATNTLARNNMAASKAMSQDIVNTMIYGLNGVNANITRTNQKLDLINTNITRLIEHNNENSNAFYERATDLMENLGRQMQNLETVLNGRDMEDNGNISFRDGFDIKAYLERAQERFGSTMIGSVSSMVKEMGTMFLDPKELAVTVGGSVIESLAPTVVKETIASVDKHLTAYLDETFKKIPDLIKDNQLLQLLGVDTMFGNQRSRVNTPFLGRASQDALPWNGVAQRALVEVIPELLTSIDQGVRHAWDPNYKKRYMDYDTGKFVDEGALYDDFRETLAAQVSFAMSDMVDELTKQMNMSGGSKKKIARAKDNISRLTSSRLFTPDDYSLEDYRETFKGELYSLGMSERVIQDMMMKFERSLDDTTETLNEMFNKISSGTSAYRHLFATGSKVTDIRDPNRKISVEDELSTRAVDIFGDGFFAEDIQDTINAIEGAMLTDLPKYKMTRDEKQLVVSLVKTGATNDLIYSKIRRMRQGEIAAIKYRESRGKIPELLRSLEERKTSLGNRLSDSLEPVMERIQELDEAAFERVFNSDAGFRLTDFGTVLPEDSSAEARLRDELAARRRRGRPPTPPGPGPGPTPPTPGGPGPAPGPAPTSGSGAASSYRSRRRRDDSQSATLTDSAIAVNSLEDIVDSTGNHSELLLNLGPQQIEARRRAIQRDIEDLVRETDDPTALLVGLVGTMITNNNLTTAELYGSDGKINEALRKTLGEDFPQMLKDKLFNEEHGALKDQVAALKAEGSSIWGQTKGELASMYDTVYDATMKSRYGEDYKNNPAYRENKFFSDTLNRKQREQRRNVEDILRQVAGDPSAPPTNPEEEPEGQGWGRRRKRQGKRALGYGYFQGNPAWGDTVLGRYPDGTLATMADAGCGPTAFANLVSMLTGQDMSPEQAAEYAKMNGFISGGGANAGLFEEGAKSFGMNPHKMGRGGVFSALRAGHPTIISGKSDSKTSPYTGAGHILLGDGMDKYGNVFVQDPSDGKRKLYKQSDIANGFGHGFSYGRRRALGYGKANQGITFEQMMAGNYTSEDIDAVQNLMDEKGFDDDTRETMWNVLLRGSEKGAKTPDDAIRMFMEDLYEGEIHGEDRRSKYMNLYEEKIKSKLPRTLASGIIGAGVGTANMLAPSLLGSALLPGGPIGGAIVGLSVGLLSKSEMFNELLFGKIDEKTGERMGALISKGQAEALKKAVPFAIGGAVTGLISGGIIKPAIGAMTGGLLGLPFLPGGIISGALVGAGIGILKNSESFKKLLFGDIGDDGRRAGTFLSDNYNALMEKVPNFKTIAARGLAGAGVGMLTNATLANMGFLPAMLSVGGPVGAGIVGLGLGIASSTKKFDEWLFGTEEVDPETGEKTGRRGGGMLTKVRNILFTNMVQPIAESFQMNVLKLLDWTKLKLLFPFQKAFGPILDSMTVIKDNVVDFIKDKFDTLGNGIKSMFELTLKKLFQPITKVIGTVGKTLLGAGRIGAELALSPLSAGLNMVGLLTSGKRRKEQTQFYKNYYLEEGGVEGKLQSYWDAKKADGQKVGFFNRVADRMQAYTGRGEVGAAAKRGWNEAHTEEGRNHFRWRDAPDKAKKVKEEAKERRKAERMWKDINKQRLEIINTDLHGDEPLELSDARFQDYKARFTKLGISEDLLKNSGDIMDLLYRTDDFRKKASVKDKSGYMNALSEFRETPEQAKAREETTQFQTNVEVYLQTIIERFEALAAQKIDKEESKAAKAEHAKNRMKLKKKLKKQYNANAAEWKGHKKIDLYSPEYNAFDLGGINQADLDDYRMSTFFEEDDFAGFLDSVGRRKTPKVDTVKGVPVDEKDLGATDDAATLNDLNATMNQVKEGIMANVAATTGGNITEDDINNQKGKDFKRSKMAKFSLINYFHGLTKRKSKEEEEAARRAKEQEEDIKARALSSQNRESEQAEQEQEAKDDAASEESDTFFGKMRNFLDNTKAGLILGGIGSGVKTMAGIGLIGTTVMTIIEMISPGTANKIKKRLDAFNDYAASGKLSDQVTATLTAVGQGIGDFIQNDVFGENGYFIKGLQTLAEIIPTVMNKFIVPAITGTVNFITRNAKLIASSAATVITTIGPPLITALVKAIPTIIKELGKGLFDVIIGKDPGTGGSSNLSKSEMATAEGMGVSTGVVKTEEITREEYDRQLSLGEDGEPVYEQNGKYFKDVMGTAGTGQYIDETGEIRSVANYGDVKDGVTTLGRLGLNAARGGKVSTAILKTGAKAGTVLAGAATGATIGMIAGPAGAVAGAGTGAKLATMAIKSAAAVTDDAQAGVVRKFLNKFTKSLTTFTNNPLVKSFSKALSKTVSFNKLGTVLSKVFKLVTKLTSKLMNKKFIGTAAKIITQKLTATSAKLAASGLTLGIADLAFLAYGTISGSSTANVANLFGVSQDSVDLPMRLISAFIGGITTTTIGSMFEIVTLLVGLCLGEDLKRSLATWLYTHITAALDFNETVEDKEAHLKTVQEQFELEVANYNALEGIQLSTEEYNDLVNKQQLFGARRDNASYEQARLAAANGELIEPADPNYSYTNTGYGTRQNASTRYSMKPVGYGVRKQKWTSSSKPNGRFAGYGYAQNNPAWANIPIGTFENGQTATMGTAGCGPTAFADAISAATGVGITPATAGVYAATNGYITDGGANEGLFTKGAARFGVSGTKIDKNTMMNSLRMGQPTVISGQSTDPSSPYTPAGHVIVAHGLGSNGDVLVNNPLTGKTERYDINKIKSGMNTGWSYSGKNTSKNKKPMGYGTFLATSGPYLDHTQVQTTTQPTTTNTSTQTNQILITDPRLSAEFHAYCNAIDSGNSKNIETAAKALEDARLKLESGGKAKSPNIKHGETKVGAIDPNIILNNPNATIDPTSNLTQMFVTRSDGTILTVPLVIGYAFDGETLKYTPTSDNSSAAQEFKYADALNGSAIIYGYTRYAASDEYSSGRHYRSRIKYSSYGRTPIYHIISFKPIEGVIDSNGNILSTGTSATELVTYDKSWDLNAFKEKMGEVSWMGKLQMIGQLISAYTRSLVSGTDLWTQYENDYGYSGTVTFDGTGQQVIDLYPEAKNATEEVLGKLISRVTSGEGGYTSVNRNDGTSFSIGINQANGNNAKKVLRAIKAKLKDSKDISMADKYIKLAGARALSATEAAELKDWLGSPNVAQANQSVQNDFAKYFALTQLLSKTSPLYDNGHLRALKNIVIPSDILNTGPHLYENRVEKPWVTKWKNDVTSIDSETDLMAQMLSSNDSFWGSTRPEDKLSASTRNAYKSRIMRTANDIKAWNPSYTMEPGKFGASVYAMAEERLRNGGADFTNLGYGEGENGSVALTQSLSNLGDQIYDRLSSVLGLDIGTMGAFSSTPYLGGSATYSGTSLGKTPIDFFTESLNATVSSKYGKRTDPVSGQVSSNHGGIDFAAAANTPIYSPISGKVSFSGFDSGGFGNYCSIVSSDGNKHYFGHMIAPAVVSAGDTVKVGDLLGYVGSTGKSTGNHLHYEIRNSSGISFDPTNYRFTGYGMGQLFTSANKPKSNVTNALDYEIGRTSDPHTTSTRARTAAGGDAQSNAGVEERLDKIFNVMAEWYLAEKRVGLGNGNGKATNILVDKSMKVVNASTQPTTNTKTDEPKILKGKMDKLASRHSAFATLY